MDDGTERRQLVAGGDMLAGRLRRRVRACERCDGTGCVGPEMAVCRDCEEDRAALLAWTLRTAPLRGMS